ncbi:hypothetical protein [Dipodfec virus RodF1_38]|uniref:Uncharacterized protein n=1 Tax=Dipodfec virus RodF1_38 TaxID=2929296 RepID=A0A976N2F9_9VIRU|nr:hypothetical protein [Dipodfec virus RodF1_38]
MAYVPLQHQSKSTSGIAGLFYHEGGPRPFLVVDKSGYWSNRLAPYCDVVPSPKDPKVKGMYFDFQGLFSCLYRFPPFATSLLNVPARSYSDAAIILLYNPTIARFTEPIGIESIYRAK